MAPTTSAALPMPYPMIPCKGFSCSCRSPQQVQKGNGGGQQEAAASQERRGRILTSPLPTTTNAWKRKRPPPLFFLQVRCTETVLMSNILSCLFRSSSSSSVAPSYSGSMSRIDALSSSSRIALVSSGGVEVLRAAKACRQCADPPLNPLFELPYLMRSSPFPPRSLAQTPKPARENCCMSCSGRAAAMAYRWIFLGALETASTSACSSGVRW